MKSMVENSLSSSETRFQAVCPFFLGVPKKNARCKVTLHQAIMLGGFKGSILHAGG